MKKFIAILCTIVLLCCSMSFLASAITADNVPLVILQGYSGPTLIDTDTGEQVWGLDFDKVGERVKEELPNIAGTAGATFTGNYSELVDVIGSVLLEVLEPIRCNADGTSAHNVTYKFQGAENCRVSTLMANGYGVAEPQLVEAIGEDRGYENIFVFNYDWRMGQVEYAAAIDAFIQEVKALTGSRQVDVFGLSHGGQCGASYLYYYGTKGDCRKAMLDVPATGGTTMVGDPMTGNPVNLDYATIVEFVEQGEMSELNLEWLIKYIGFEHLNEVVTLLCEEYIVDYIKCMPSIWDFVPLAVFDEALAYTATNEYNSGALYENTLKFHKEAMAHMSEGLQIAKDAGVQIAIMSNYGHENVTGSNKHSDYIIDTTTSSGAYCAPFDSKFQADYECKNTNCSDPSHYHISPERNVDATSAYLPDNTWFINGQFHGMYVFDTNTKGFVIEFLQGDSIKDVYSNSKYPQFMRSQNVSDGLYVQFDNTASGFHTAKDTKLILTNLSSECDIKIRYMNVKGSDIVLEPNTSSKIGPGQQAEISFNPYTLPDSTSPFEITIIYTLYNNERSMIIQRFEFTALSSEQAETFNYFSQPAPVYADLINLNANEGGTTTAGGSETTTAASTAGNTSGSPQSPTNPKTGSSVTKTVGIAGICVASLAVAGYLVKKKIDE